MKEIRPEGLNFRIRSLQKKMRLERFVGAKTYARLAGCVKEPAGFPENSRKLIRVVHGCILTRSIFFLGGGGKNSHCVWKKRPGMGQG